MRIAIVGLIVSIVILAGCGISTDVSITSSSNAERIKSMDCDTLFHNASVYLARAELLSQGPRDGNEALTGLLYMAILDYKGCQYNSPTEGRSEYGL